MTVRRRIDDGRPLQLLDPPGGGDRSGFAVSTLICDNPSCPCTRMSLDIRPVRRRDDGGLQIDVDGPMLGGEVSANGADLKLESHRPGVFTDAATAWICEQLNGADHRAWLHERWCRMRAGVGDPAYPSGVPPEEIDGMVFFSEVFPWDFDLTVILDRRMYLIDDQYCLEPACTCDEVSVQFIDVSTETTKQAQNVGHVQASVRRLGDPKFHGQPIVPRLWSALLAEHGRTELRQRFKRMREVARQRRRLAAPTPQSKVGRNAPCPCGSGKKYKRCCGG